MGKLAEFLGVNRSMIFFYLNETSKLPLKHYLNLCDLIGAAPDSRLSHNIINNKENFPDIPALSEKIAEFLGALAGDGHMNKMTYEISISLDKDLDKEYSFFVQSLFQELFGIAARRYVQKSQNKVKCFIYCKKLVEYLSQEYSLPTGKKKGSLHIPKKIMADKRYLKAYIRGVFDTDGSINRHHKNTAMVGLISRDSGFIRELRSALQILGFKTSLSKKNLNIYAQDHIDMFFEQIRPSNTKHLFKYDYYKKNSTVPLTKDILKR